MFQGTHKAELRKELTKKKTAKHTVLDREVETWVKREASKQMIRLEVGDMVLFNTAAVHRPVYDRSTTSSVSTRRLALGHFDRRKTSVS